MGAVKNGVLKEETTLMVIRSDRAEEPASTEVLILILKENVVTALVTIPISLQGSEEQALFG